MRIVLINHGTASEWGGGDSVQIKETARVLRNRGHEVVIQNKDRPDLREADIAHIFNCRVPGSFIKQISTCQTAGVPIVVSPIWISIGKALWGSRGTFGILRRFQEIDGIQIREELNELKSRNLIVDMGMGNLNSDGKGTYDLSWLKNIQRLMKTVDGLLPNSWLELKSVQNDLLWSGENYGVAYYGVDPKKFLDARPEKFREYTGIKGEFLLQAGRIEPGKNQAMLCWALKNTNIPIVLIGSSKHWPAYAELCKGICDKQVTIIDHLPQDILASAYAAARVHSLISWMDTCGLVSLEAAMSNTPIVGSTFGHELEYLQNDAWLADPGNPEDIEKTILKAWECGKNNKKVEVLKERIMSEYNWEKTVTNTEKIYMKAIESA